MRVFIATISQSSRNIQSNLLTTIQKYSKQPSHNHPEIFKATISQPSRNIQSNHMTTIQKYSKQPSHNCPGIFKATISQPSRNIQCNHLTTICRQFPVSSSKILARTKDLVLIGLVKAQINLCIESSTRSHQSLCFLHI